MPKHAELSRVLRIGALCASLSFLLSPVCVYGQGSCPSLTEKVKSPAGNMFNEEQEVWLGEVLADFIEHSVPVIRDTPEIAHLQQIGDKILAALPPTKVKYQFFLIDAGEVNGFSIAGGRIYIDRKLIVSAKNEDEVAGVVGHEIGHIITHQSALEISQQFRKLLHVNAVTDKADILAKYHQLLDEEEKRSVSGHSEDDDQGVADYVGIVGMAAAGYAPSTFAEFWDRSFFVQNKTGSRLTDLLRSTTPDQKRLRGMRQTIAGLPEGCGAKAPAENTAFQTWRDAVLVHQRTVRHASSEMEDSKIVPLSPVLRTDLVALRFSRDGRMLFAQDESTVVVFDVASGKELFRFDADYALPAQWSPDSERIVFHTDGLHVEVWDVKNQKRVAAYEMVVKPTCWQSVLSPDGRSMVCVAKQSRTEPFFDLHIFDVATNAELFSHTNAFYVSGYSLRNFLKDADLTISRELLTAAVSPDGNKIVIGSGKEKFAFDFAARKEIQIGGDFKHQTSATFAFEGDDIAGEDLGDPKESGLFTFPEGKRIASVPAHLGSYTAATKGDLVLTASPHAGQSLGLDFRTGKVLFQAQSRMLDVWKDTVAAESPSGDVLLGAITSQPLQLSRVIKMPPTYLGPLKTTLLSADGKYLAASAQSRGAVWDVATGKRIYNMRGFTKVGFTDSHLFLDMPKHDKSERAIFRIKLGQTSGEHVDVSLERSNYLAGSHLIQWKRDVDGFILTVTDLNTGQDQWHRRYAGDGPPWNYNRKTDTLLLAWTNRMSGGVEESKENQALGKAFAALKNKDNWLLMEVINASTGQIVRSVATPRPAALNTHANFLLISDTVITSGRDNRINFLSATTGTVIKEVFGHLLAESSELGQICIQNRADELAIYDLQGNQQMHLEVGKIVRAANFDDTRHRLVVLGADQKLRFISLEQKGAQ